MRGEYREGIQDGPDEERPLPKRRPSEDEANATAKFIAKRARDAAITLSPEEREDQRLAEEALRREQAQRRDHEQ